MLKNAYFLAKIGADTAENEQHFAEILPIGRRVAAEKRRARRRRVPRRGAAAPSQLPIFGKFSAKCRSFSAVSASIFASKYAFFSIFQNLPDNPAENFEIWQYFANFATFAIFLLDFHEKC